MEGDRPAQRVAGCSTIPGVGESKSFLLYHEELESLVAEHQGPQADPVLDDVRRDVPHAPARARERRHDRASTRSSSRARRSSRSSSCKRAAARPGVARRRTTPARPRSAASSRASRTASEQALLHLQHLRPRRDATRKCARRRSRYTTGVPAVTGAVMMVTGKWQRRRRVQHGAARSRSVPRRARASAACPGTSKSAEQLRSVRSANDVARAIDLASVETPVLRHRPRRARGEPARSSPTCSSARGCTILLALKGFAQWSTFPLVQQLPRRRDARARPHEARLGARGARRRGPRLRAGVLRRRDAASSSRSPITSCSTRSRSGSASAARSRRARAGRSLVRAARQPRAPRGRGRALRPVRAVLAARHHARELPAGEPRRASTACTSTRCASSTADALERALAAFEEKFGDFIPRHEVDQLRRRAPHHAPRLRRRRAGAPGARLPRRAIGVQRLPRARRGDRARHRRARRVGARHVPTTAWPIAILDTSATAHMPDVLEMPYRPRDRRRGRAGREAAHLPARRPDLPRRRRDRRLLASTARSRSATGSCSSTWRTTRW